MNDEQIESTVKQIIASLFDIDPAVIGPSSSPETIQAWDSVGQMNLILSLEEEFNISFTDTQVLEMVNFQLICMTIREALDSK